jgi:hypothetical protein
MAFLLRRRTDPAEALGLILSPAQAAVQAALARPLLTKRGKR